ncbi:MAG: ATP-binding protein [Candidatus Aenigmarchaeota archaeon]|nr:ATP-binding protein [Candidatus Aenigmarchaeota archaeon]
MLLSFVDRERELGMLEERYRSNKAELIPIYGRRRVGKTELIKEFIRNKPHFYFLAKRKKLEEEMERFRVKFSKEFNIFLPEEKSWDTIFENILRSQKHRVVVIIDEFPFWVEKDISVVSDFQHLWDETLKDKNIFLILCGSYVSVMETSVMGYKSPLYGRRTAQMEVNRLGFRDFTKFFPKWQPEEIIKAYGALDGIPFYIKEFELDRSFQENVEKTFWKSDSILNKEAEFLLSQELREVEVYLGIMRSIFEGATKLNEIATKSHVAVTNINKYIRILTDLKFVSKEYPVIVNRPKRKNYVYRIADNFFNFWLSYVYPFKDEIEIGEIESLKIFFRKDYSRYLGFVFENIARQLIWHMKLPFKPTKAGRWWHKNEEIDLVCSDENKRKALFIECKWSDLKEREARHVLQELKEKSKSVLWERETEYFGLIGKTIGGKEKLSEEGFIVFDVEDLWRIAAR